MKRIVTMHLNGRECETAVADNILLIDHLRDEFGLTGAKQGCDGGECGACTVLIDDRPRLACLTLASACEGRKVETIEALAQGNRLSKLQRNFHEKLGTQCGFCTPGMILSSEALLRENQNPDRREIEIALSGNLCRCTGFVKIIDAVEASAGTNA